MANQINPSVTNPSIAELYQSIKSKKLILKPDFQRKFVWTHDHQENFIDTILKGYPFPEIYVCEGEINVEKIETTQNVIDGQQRLTTILKYIEGDYDRELNKIPPFSSLGDKTKDFLKYKVVVRDLGSVEDDIVREIFRRINLTKFKLENVEIHNAIYDGKFIQTAKKIVENSNIKKYGVFFESEFTRMADLHFMLLVMSTIEFGGYFPEDKEVENYIARFNDEYENSEEIYNLINSVFEKIDEQNLDEKSIWFRKSNFFTMFSEFSFHIDHIPENTGEKLRDLEEKIIENRHNSSNEFGLYYRYMYSGTNQRKARVTRSQIFQKEILLIDEHQQLTNALSSLL